MQVESYLFFDGRCEEALEFYRKALDAEVTALMRYKESPEPAPCRPGSEEKILHAVFRVGDSAIMASDDCSGHPVFGGFSLAISLDDEAVAKRYFAALSDGGQVEMPMGKTFFSPCFGMCTDHFGVMWMIMVAQP